LGTRGKPGNQGNAVAELLLFSGVPLLYRAKIPHHPGVNLRALLAERTKLLGACQIPMVGADGEGGGKGEVGDAETLKNPAHKSSRSFRRRNPLPKPDVKHRAPSIPGLKRLLQAQSQKEVIGEIHGKLGGVGVVRAAPRSSTARSLATMILGKRVFIKHS